MYNSVVIKIGTNVITKEDGFLDVGRMEHIVAQIASLKKRGVNVTMVSSGAMGAGRKLVNLKKTKDEVGMRQTLAAVGQIPLMNTYRELFEKHDLSVAQVLATKDDFRDRQHYLNMKHCFDALTSEGIIPILNENDVVAVEEIMFTDNDELAGLVAAMQDADALIILTSVDGVYNGDPDDASSKLLSHIDADELDAEQFATTKRSSLGRGGMGTKLAIAKRAAQFGAVTHIINGQKEHTITDVCDEKQVGTTVTSNKKRISAVKKWIAHSDGALNGSIQVNQRAVDVICDTNKATSILPVGVIAVTGDFEEGDVIDVLGEDGSKIAMGRAEYTANQARSAMGKKGEKVLVHYDYLVLL